ncbi:MAG: helix-turn-helix domain-containing protein [Oligoflexia bacterium]|nr:helix-turn-helix domain-containing protein [Oligoflexia bacterium]MBF0365884.1 helix-turn-helix domain-containing protein [Oligoflexia bacterium]
MNLRRDDQKASDAKNYYEVLEVDTSATQDQIYEGYVRAKNTYSGDGLALYSVMTREECLDMLDLIEAAYSVLSIPYKRREYDQVKGIGASGGSLSFGPNASSAFVLRERDRNDRQQYGNSVSSSSSFNPLSSNANTTAYRNDQQTTLVAPTVVNTKPKDLSQIIPLDFQKEFQINRKEADVSRLSAQKRFGLNYNVDDSFENEVAGTTRFTGEFLKRIREYKNVPLDRMCDLTKISRSYIKSIEDDDFCKLPALTYVRGFVYQYAKCLRLNAEMVATSYVNHLKEIQAHGK